MNIYEDTSEDTLVSTREVAEVKVTGSVWRHKVDIQSRFDHRHTLVPDKGWQSEEPLGRCLGAEPSTTSFCFKMPRES